MMLNGVYPTWSKNDLAMPVIQGRARPRQNAFPGAIETMCIEAMMQDRKALQAGTSHFLGQNFAKSLEYPLPDRERNRGFRLDHLMGYLYTHDRRSDHDPRRR
jgi:prolyl-tRNA synthetase